MAFEPLFHITYLCHRACLDSVIYIGVPFDDRVLCTPTLWLDEEDIASIS